MVASKKFLLGVAILVAILSSIPVYILYWSYHPSISISIQGSTRDGFHLEFPGLIMSSLDIIRVKSIEENLMEFFMARDEVDTYIRSNCIAPTDVRLSAGVENGKTILRYEGTITTKDGVTKPYKNELVFDFILDPDLTFSTN